MQSVPITTRVVSWNHVHREVYPIQTLCDKVCQWLTTGMWFSPVSSTNNWQPWYNWNFAESGVNPVCQTSTDLVPLFTSNATVTIHNAPNIANVYLASDWTLVQTEKRYITKLENRLNPEKIGAVVVVW